MAHDNLNAGFTGTPAEKATGVRRVAQNAGEIARSEAQAVVAGVSDHPHTASTVVLGIGALAFGLGYLLGRSSGSSSSRGFWG